MKILKRIITILVAVAIVFLVRYIVGNNYLKKATLVLDPSKRIELFSKSATWGNDSAVIMRAMTYIEQANYSKALADLDLMEKKAPDYPIIYMYKGTAYSALKDYSKAVENYNKCFVLLKPYIENTFGKKKFFGISSEKYGLTKTEIDNKLHSALFVERSRALRHLGKYADALLDSDKSVMLNPTIPDTYTERGNVFLEIKDYKKALSDFDSALKLEAEYSPAFLGKGKLFLEQKNALLAVAELEKAVFYSPQSAKTHYYLAEGRYALKQYDAALKAITISLKLDPSNPTAKELRTRLEK